MDADTAAIRPVFLFTMTAGLGDLIVMGDLARKVEKLVPGSVCLFVHRSNPHTALMDGNGGEKRFFNIASAGELAALYRSLKGHREGGNDVFALQMAPGSLQGFFFYTLLKRLGLVDYIVDFNLCNADIITPPQGNYILELHLNQIAQLLQLELPQELYRLQLPFQAPPPRPRPSEGKIIGIHPWSRRGHLESFVWQKEKWLSVIAELLLRPSVAEVVVFGRDAGFAEFSRFIQDPLGDGGGKLAFSPSQDVKELVATIAGIDCLVSVNTATGHIGYALQKEMVLLCGPSLDLWTPKGPEITVLRDRHAAFQASDKWTADPRFGSIARIEVPEVLAALRDSA